MNNVVMNTQYSLFNKYIPCCQAMFSNRSLMTSKCGKNKKVAQEVIASVINLRFTVFLHSHLNFACFNGGSVAEWLERRI